jgi:hypothetical protein
VADPQRLLRAWKVRLLWGVVDAPADSKKVPRGCAWTMVVVGVLLLVLGVISFMAIPILWKRSQEVWTETQGTLVESYVKQGIRRNSGGSGWNDARSGATTYDVRLTYRYQVDGTEHSGDVNAPRQPDDDEKWDEAKAVRESYKDGEAIAVYYKPGEPAKSRLMAEQPRVEFTKDLMIVAMYLLGGWGLFVWGRKLLR